MEVALGLIGVVLFIAAVIGLAAGVTYLVVKLTPSKAAKERQQGEAAGS